MPRDAAITPPDTGLSRRSVVAGLASAPILLGTHAAWAQEIKRGGTMVVAIQDNPPHLLTGISVDILTICVAGQIYDTLIRMDPDFKLRSSLARSWTASADGREFRFALEPGVTWHDSQPFTSAD